MYGFNLVLASKTEEENQILRKKIEILQLDFPQIKFSGLHPQGLALAAHERLGAVVINVPEWNRAEAANLKLLHDAGYRGPVLVTAKASMNDALKNLRLNDQVVFLEKPFDAKDLQGIVRKMICARRVAQRVHRRFNTDESAEVEVYGRADRFRSKVFNMSKGGAYLEFQQAAPIRAGDILKVKVELSNVSRIYTVSGRVVWNESMKDELNEPLPGSIRVGVEFIGSADVTKMAIRNY